MKKRYYNATTHEWYTEGQTMTRTVNGVLFSGVPSVEQLTDWGFVEYVEPEPTPEQLLEQAKQKKISELMAYDNSDAVNQFYLGEYPLWLDFDERERLKAQIESRLRLGYQTMTKTYEGLPAVTFPLSAWQIMSDQLEAYAGDCQEVTNGHKVAINSSLTVQEVEGYDFTVDYPNKPVFNLQDLA